MGFLESNAPLFFSQSNFVLKLEDFSQNGTACINYTQYFPLANSVALHFQETGMYALTGICPFLPHEGTSSLFESSCYP